MRAWLRRLFGPILRPFERGDTPYEYKPSHRRILLIMSVMFIGLAALVLWVMPGFDASYLLPVIVFGGAGLLGIVIGTLGEDRAVARIWGSR